MGIGAYPGYNFHTFVYKLSGYIDPLNELHGHLPGILYCILFWYEASFP